MRDTQSDVEHRRLMVDGVPFHYVVAGRGRPLLLIHGFPQTSRQWMPLIAILGSEFRVIAPDLRGIGAGPGPFDGYDKHSLATDLEAIVAAECGEAPVLVCGHDMGSFVAFAYALRHRSRVAGLMLLDAPPPGTTAWSMGSGSPRAFHVSFHANVDLALMLVSGRERAYIHQFIQTRSYDASAVGPDDIDAYAAAYSAPRAMRAAFQMYRALIYEDAALNAESLAAGRLGMPVVLVGGSETTLRSVMEATIEEIATHGAVEVIDRCGHRIPEERPERLSELIRDLAARSAWSDGPSTGPTDRRSV